jgi:hypothetical protein
MSIPLIMHLSSPCTIIAHVPPMNSLASSLVFGVTLARNRQGGGGKVIGQVGYAATAVVATIESLAALTFCTASLAIYPVSSVPFDKSVKWLGSSSFSIAWSVVDLGLNLLPGGVLIADESSARQIARSCNFFMNIPPGAII